MSSINNAAFAYHVDFKIHLSSREKRKIRLEKFLSLGFGRARAIREREARTEDARLATNSFYERRIGIILINQPPAIFTDPFSRG